MRLIVLTLVAVLGTTYHAAQDHTEAPEVIVEPVVTLATVPTTTTTSTTTTTTTTTIPEGLLCPEWHELASEVLPDDVTRWDYVIWRESRCLADAFNPSDPNGGSIGLVQINRFWCLPSRYHPQGWLQEQGIVGSCDDLYDPRVNFDAAHAIWHYAEARGCGWSPWSTRRTRWC